MYQIDEDTETLELLIPDLLKGGVDVFLGACLKKMICMECGKHQAAYVLVFDKKNKFICTTCFDESMIDEEKFVSIEKISSVIMGILQNYRTERKYNHNKKLIVQAKKEFTNHQGHLTEFSKRSTEAAALLLDQAYATHKQLHTVPQFDKLLTAVDYQTIWNLVEKCKLSDECKGLELEDLCKVGKEKQLEFSEYRELEEESKRFKEMMQKMGRIQSGLQQEVKEISEQCMELIKGV